MQIVKKISIALIAVIAILTIQPQQSKALNTTQIISGGQNFLDGANDKELFDEQSEREGLDQLYYIMLTIGIIAAFIIGSILGIQFITTGAAGQAKVKEKIIPFVVGAVVIFGAFGIWRIVLNVYNNIFS